MQVGKRRFSVEKIYFEGFFRCGPCKVLGKRFFKFPVLYFIMMKLIEPRLEKVLTDHNKKAQGASGDQQIQLAKVDIDSLGELSSKYNVQAVPTGE
jgi:thioredoxin-like negative regulator of GroEL